MHLPFAQGKSYAVLGLGKSGRSAVASLIASGAMVTAWDDSETARHAAQKENPTLQITAPDAWIFSTFSAVVASPGIPHRHAAIVAAHAAGVEVINDIELLVRANPNATVVGITGTNGKSTTTTLIAHVLKACGKRVEVGGNLGIPALELAVLGGDGIYAIELSSYQLEAAPSLHCRVAVWMNISPDHLDHHGSMDAYVDAKKNIFLHQTKNDVAVIGVDDATSEAVARALISAGVQTVVPISGKSTVQHGVSVQGSMLMSAQGKGDLRDIKSLQGEHNGQNAAAAYAACAALGCAHDDMMAAMQSYVGLPHRMQYLGECAGVQFINDSKATNADAAEKSLRTFDAMYWILGGVAKEGGIESLAPYFHKIRHAYLIGEAAEMFAQTLEGQVAFTPCGTLSVAFEKAMADAANDASTPLKTLVLAPACASFDQFPNFEKRGEAFVALVGDYCSKYAGGTHAATA